MKMTSKFSFLLYIHIHAAGLRSESVLVSLLAVEYVRNKEEPAKCRLYHYALQVEITYPWLAVFFLRSDKTDLI